MGMLAATGGVRQPAAILGDGPSAERDLRDGGYARRAAHVRHRSGHRSAGVGGDVRRSREARAGHDAAGGSRHSRQSSWQRIAGAAARAADGSAQGRPRTRTWRPPPYGRRRSIDTHGRAQRATRSCAAALRPRPCRPSDADIAFAPVTQLSRWIEQRQLTSERLTRIYLQRIDALDPKLRSVITKTAGSCAGAGRSRPMPRSPPAATAARCTAFPTA